MSTKIGFYGIEAFDIIQYLSRVMKHLGKKVLLVDQSAEKALMHSVSMPAEFMDKADYRGIGFLNDWLKEELNRADIVLVDMGKTGNRIKECDTVYFVTDYELHNIHRIKNIRLRETNLPDKQYLIIRDLTNTRKVSYVKEQCGFEDRGDFIYYIADDLMNYRLRLKCQYNNVFYFHKLSPDFKDMMFHICMDSIEGITKKELKTAYHKAERGK